MRYHQTFSSNIILNRLLNPRFFYIIHRLAGPSCITCMCYRIHPSSLSAAVYVPHLICCSGGKNRGINVCACCAANERTTSDEECMQAAVENRYYTILRKTYKKQKLHGVIRGKKQTIRGEFFLDLLNRKLLFPEKDLLL